MWPLTKNAKGGDLSETDTRLTQNDPEETLIDTIISVRNSAILLKNSTLWGKWHSDIDGNDAG
jgi:hypothetical protein